MEHDTAVLIVVFTLVVVALLLDFAAKPAAAAKQRADDHEEAAAEMDRLRPPSPSLNIFLSACPFHRATRIYPLDGSW
jgi:hypothetical protein